LDQTTPTAPGVIHARSGTMGEAISMAAPLVVSFISFSMMGLVDALIMGHVGTTQQGAVGLGAMLAWTIGTVFVGTMTVINTFAAQDFGAGRRETLRRHVHAGAVLIVPFTAIIWALLPLVPKLIDAMGTAAAVTPHVDVYVSIRMLGAPFLLTSFVITSFLRGLGDMRTPMMVTITANVINIFLSLMLVFGWFGLPRLGVAGVALASLLAMACEATLYLRIYFGPKIAALYQTRRWLRPEAAELRRFLRIGLPIGFSWFFDIVGWTVFSVFVSTLSPADLAAHTIVFQILHFSFLPAAAISVAATTLVGQYVGAGRTDLAERAAKASVAIGVGYMAAAGLVLIALRVPLVTAFNPNPLVVVIGAKIALIGGLFQPFDGLGMVLGGALRGGGDTRYPMGALLVSASCVFIPGVYLLGNVIGLGIVGAWLGALVHVVFLSGLLVLRFRAGKWKTASLD
jgi:MATE family, multidrug efflux pump